MTRASDKEGTGQVRKEPSTPRGLRVSEAIVRTFVNLEFMLTYKLYDSADKPSHAATGREFAEYAKNGLLIGEIGYILGSHTRVDRAYRFWFEFLKGSLIRDGAMDGEFVAYISRLANKSQVITNHCSRLARLGMLEVRGRGIYRTRYGAGPNIYYSPQALSRLRTSLKSAKADNCWSNGRVTIVGDRSFEDLGFSKAMVEGLMNDLDTVAREVYVKRCDEWFEANGKEPLDAEEILARAEQKHGTPDGSAFGDWFKGLGDAVPTFPIIVIDPNPSALRWRRSIPRDTRSASGSRSGKASKDAGRRPGS